MDRAQQVILGIAGVVVLYQAFRGWRIGPARQLIRFVALAVAYAASFMGAPSLVPLLRPLHFPDFLLQSAAGLFLALLAYFLVNLVGGILFKKTTDQGFGLVWLFYGATGALLGMAFGAVLLVVATVAIRFAGAMAEGVASTPPAPGRTVPPVASAVLMVNHCLDTSLPSQVLKSVDPVPKEAYETIGKVGKVASQPQAVNRFLEYPGARDFIENPEIAALQQDPEIAREIASHNYLALLRNQRVVKTCNDPKLAKLLKKFDINKALDFALQEK